MPYCRSCREWFDLPSVGHETDEGKRIRCTSCVGAEAEVDALGDDFFQEITALLDAQDHLAAHGDPYETDAEIPTLFAPDQ